MTGPLEPQVTYVPSPAANPYAHRPHSPYGTRPRPYAYTPKTASLPSAPPPRRSRRRTAVAVATTGVAALAVGTTVAVLVTSRASTHRAGPPTTFDGYHRLDSAASHQIEASVRSSGSTDPVVQTVYDAAAVGVYARDAGDVPTLVTLTLPTTRARALGVADHATTAHELLVQTANQRTPTSTAAAVTNGGDGGDGECAYATVGTVAETVCTWSDERTTGLIVSTAQPRLSARRLDALALDLRAALH